MANLEQRFKSPTKKQWASARRLQRRKAAQEKMGYKGRIKRMTRKPAKRRQVTLNQLVSRLPGANTPVIVFPNISTFRSTARQIPSTKRKISAYLPQAGGGFKKIRV